MANHKSAKKMNKVIQKRTIVRRNRLSEVRTYIKNVEKLIEKKDQKAANEALRAVQSAIMKAVNKNIIKLNTASRKIHRLNSKIKAIATAA